MFNMVQINHSNGVQVSKKVTLGDLREILSKRLPLVIGVLIDTGENDVCRLKIFVVTR